MRPRSWRSALIKKDQAGADKLANKTVEDTETGEQVKSVLLQPQPIFPENVKDVVADGYVEASAICTNAKLKAACEENGVG